jgi:DNA-binding MarR family transcriptional regulator
MKLLTQLLRAHKASLSTNALATLLLIRSEAKTFSALTRSLSMTNGGFTRIADSLETKGLATRETNRRDRRAWWLTITPQGQEVLNDITKP